MTIVIKNSKQLADAKEMLEDLKKAKKKILLAGQAYGIGGQTMQRADLKEISEEISMYEQAIDAYESHGTTKRRVVRAVPLG